MESSEFRFASLAEAIVALRAMSEPAFLTRFEPTIAERVIIAVSPSAAANPASPRPGERPDTRRDRDITADIELDYLYRQLVERGHARQVISIGGRFRELSVSIVAQQTPLGGSGSGKRSPAGKGGARLLLPVRKHRGEEDGSRLPYADLH